MRYYLLIFFALFTVYKCSEDYRIHFVNKTDGRKELSIVRTKTETGYIFKSVPNFVVDSPVARAILIEQINSTGWSHLIVQTSDKYSDEVQAYFSGVVEGLISRRLIAAHWYNTYEGYCQIPSDYCTKLQKFLQQNFLSLVEKTRNGSGILKMIRLQLWQIKGIQDGFDGNWKDNSTEINENHLLKMQYQMFQLYLLQADGDLPSLSAILSGSMYHSRFTGKNPFTNERCSALIKYVKGSIFSSHVTWNVYSSMLRMTKLYEFPYRINQNENQSPLVPGKILSFSSYPGIISSLDDFYMSSAGLVTIETTIGNNNQSLFKPLKFMASEIVLEYLRVMAANRLSTTGLQWSQLFSMNNSGTYNNQWMIVNYNLMKDHRYGQHIPDGVLYVAEQIPSLVIYGDVTDYLRTLTYWPSYNIPYNETIWNVGNFQSNVDKFGDLYDYHKSPRAQMFKRLAPNVVDEVSLMRLMRYNDYKHDPLAKCKCDPPYSALNGISARADLNQQNGTYQPNILGYGSFGGYDMKFTTTELVSMMKYVAINGPTYDQQPVFDWSKIPDPKPKHRLQPERFQFPPVLVPFP